MEVAPRHTWLPVGTTDPTILRLNGLNIELDEREGMAQVQRKGPNGKKYWCPIGSMPVTGRELLATLPILVQLGPNRHASQGVYAMMRRYTNGVLAEDLYRPQEDEVLYRPPQPQPQRPQLYVVG